MFRFSPWKLWKWSNLRVAYFSDGLLQPPPFIDLRLWVWTIAAILCRPSHLPIASWSSWDAMLTSKILRSSGKTTWSSVFGFRSATKMVGFVSYRNCSLPRENGPKKGWEILAPPWIHFFGWRDVRRCCEHGWNKTKKTTAWNPKQPFINGCFNWMIPNVYIENGCFTKHPFINGCLGFQVWVKDVNFGALGDERFFFVWCLRLKFVVNDLTFQNSLEGPMLTKSGHERFSLKISGDESPTKWFMPMLYYTSTYHRFTPHPGCWLVTTRFITFVGIPTLNLENATIASWVVGVRPGKSSCWGADLCVEREAYLIGGGQCICVEAGLEEFLGDSKMFDLKSPTKMFLCTYLHQCMYMYIHTYTLPGRNIWDDTGNKNYNLEDLLPYSFGPVWSSGPVVLWPPQTQAPQDFASFPVENLLIYQPSTATFLQAASLDPLHNNMVNPDLLLESEGSNQWVRARDFPRETCVCWLPAAKWCCPWPWRACPKSIAAILWRRSCCLTTYVLVDLVKDLPQTTAWCVLTR